MKVNLCRAHLHSNTCKMEFTLLSPLEKSLMVGNPWILISSTSLAVESILAITISSESLKCSPNLSQMGTSCLQCPEKQNIIMTIGLHTQGFFLCWPQKEDIFLTTFYVLYFSHHYTY